MNSAPPSIFHPAKMRWKCITATGVPKRNCTTGEMKTQQKGLQQKWAFAAFGVDDILAIYEVDGKR